MTSLENASPARQGLCVDDAAGRAADGGNTNNTSRLRRRRAERRPRRVGPYGAILLMTTLVQRSMAAGSFFKVRGTKRTYFFLNCFSCQT